MKTCPYGCIDRICAEHPGDGEPCPLGYEPPDEPKGSLALAVAILALPFILLAWGWGG